MYRRALAIDPDNFPALANYGVMVAADAAAAVAVGEPGSGKGGNPALEVEAEALLRRSLALHATCVPVLVSLAQLLLAAGRDKTAAEARELLQRALEADPGNSEAKAALASIEGSTA